MSGPEAEPSPGAPSAGSKSFASMTGCFYCARAFEGGTFQAREMMFGTREPFSYAECPGCGSVQLATPLASFDLAAHYPADYYSFAAPWQEPGALRLFLSRSRGRHVLGGFDPVGALMSLVKPMRTAKIAALKRYGVRPSDRVLDVGAGSGAFLAALRESGFDGLTGCDPFIAAPIERSGIRVLKCSVGEMTGRYEAIFFNHSFEHLTDPRDSLTAARRLQAAGGRCVIRCPTTSSEAFATYRENWLELDPPRHISVPSREGMRVLADAVGYELVDMVDDSEAWDFIGSEQIRRGIAWVSPASHNVDPAAAPFTADELAGFARRAEAANAAGRGGRTAFVLRAR